jgi:hypothetical protein
MRLLTTAPAWTLIPLLFLFTALAMAGPILIRRRVPLARLRTNNEVAGFKFATIGVLYAVLLAFVVVITWERFYDADKALAAEAGSAATLFRLSTGLSGEAGAALRHDVADYLNSVLADDYPAMAAGHASPSTTRALNHLYDELLRNHPQDLRDSDLQQELIYQLDQLTQARRARLVMADGTVPDVIWFVLLLGAALTICFTFFFGTENVYTQSLMTGVLAAVILSSVLVVVALDRPFTGAVVVSNQSIRTVLAEFRTAEAAARAAQAAGSSAR